MHVFVNLSVYFVLQDTISQLKQLGRAHSVKVVVEVFSADPSDTYDR